MSTKSIINNVIIKNKADGRSLVKALIKAENKVSKDIEFSCPVKVADDIMIKNIFTNKN